MRTFSLKDDCTLSGRRLRRDERSAQPVRGSDRASSAGGGAAQGGEHCSRVEGGGYVDLTAPLVPSGSRHVLLPAHGVVEDGFAKRLEAVEGIRLAH